MTRTARAGLLSLCVGAVATIAACSHKKVVELAPIPLDDSSAAALQWVDRHAAPIETDSMHVSDQRALWAPIVRDVKILGVSELNEGTHEFPAFMRRLTLELGKDFGFRGLAIQGPMAEAMDVDRYVRTGVGEPKKLLHALGAQHWERQEMLELLDSLRAYNAGKSFAQQIGFYGFENPTLRRAVQVDTSLAVGTISAGLKGWLKTTLGCVAMGEGANWGKEGLASDTLFWTQCGIAAAAVIDSLAAARKAATNPAAVTDIAYAEQMARLIRHGVMTGLRRVSRPEVVSEHVLFIASEVGAGNLLVWGRDYEAGRIELDKTVIQMAVPLTKRIGQRYVALAFTFGDGSLRTHLIAPGKDAGDERDVEIERPLAGTYENVFIRAQQKAFLLDMRTLQADMGSKWLGGPHPMRVITGSYSPLLVSQLQHEMEFPRMYDGIVFVRTVRPATRLR